MMGNVHLSPTYPIDEIRDADADDMVRLVGDFNCPAINDFLAIDDADSLKNIGGFVIAASRYRAVVR